MIKIILIILLFLFIIGLSLKNNEENFQNKPKIAVYCYNFGNFRNELKKKKKKESLDRFNKDNRFDYYFFTDIKNVTSKKWNVINVPLRERTPHMNSNRVTAKYYKWKFIPDELKNYDYILHIDCGKIHWLNKFKYEDITSLIKHNPKVLFFGRKHPFLKSIYNECDFLVRQTKLVDNKSNVKKWKQLLLKKKFKQKFTHVETGFHLKKNDFKTNTVLSKVYDNIMKNELCRDQLVFNYILQKNLNKSQYLIYKKFS